MNKKAGWFIYIAFIVSWLYCHLSLFVVVSWLNNRHSPRNAEPEMTAAALPPDPDTQPPDTELLFLPVIADEVPAEESIVTNQIATEQPPAESSELITPEPVPEPLDESTARPSLGMERDELIAQFGQPSGSVEMDNATSLLYDTGSVTLISNRVTEVNWRTEEEIRKANALLKKQLKDAAQLSENRAQRFAANLELYQAQYDQLEEKRLALSEQLEADKQDYSVQHSDMIKYESQINYSGDAYDSKYISAKKEVNRLNFIIRKNSAELATLQKKQKKLSNNINTHKAFLKRISTEEEEEGEPSELILPEE